MSKNNKTWEAMEELLKQGETSIDNIMDKLKKLQVRNEIGVVNISTNKNPKYETDGSAGFDLRANLEHPIILKKNARAIIPTGLFFDIPLGYEIQIRPRSGLAAKHGVTVLNTPGTIDSDYVGEVKIILINLGDEDFKIEHGERIAQAVVGVSNQFSFIFKDEIGKNTERGANGFGSTGTK